MKPWKHPTGATEQTSIQNRWSFHIHMVSWPLPFIASDLCIRLRFGISVFRVIVDPANCRESGLDGRFIGRSTLDSRYWLFLCSFVSWLPRIRTWLFNRQHAHCSLRNHGTSCRALVLIRRQNRMGYRCALRCTICRKWLCSQCPVPTFGHSLNYSLE